jgi:uncharacterized protein (DUF1501 family)
MPRNNTSRRDVLKVGLGGLGMISLGGAVPTLVPKLAFADQAVGTPVANDNILVVLQLSGGNDGLNTLVPLGNDDYHKARPRVGLKPGEHGLHDIGDGFALNPGMGAFKKLYDQGHLAVIHGTGYPQPNRSHFESMAVWHSADPSRSDPKGWLGHYLDHMARGTQPGALSAVNIGDEVPQALVTDGPPTPSINRLSDFGLRFDDSTNFDRELEDSIIREMAGGEYADPKLDYFARQANNAIVSADQIRKVAESYTAEATYPTGLGDRLKLIARIISGNFGTRVFYCQIGGFDTHANQVQNHENLLRQVSDSIAAFYEDLDAKKLSSKVTTMVFSEFGRRVGQNDSQGTDHGAAGPMFVVGPAVQGGQFGAPPSLAEDDQIRGDLAHTVDFRRVYATLLDNWLNSDSSAVLKGKYEHLPLL